MKFSTKIAKEATISLAGMGFGDAVRYLFTGLLARFVGVKYLGIYSLANSVTRLAEVFGKAGLDGGILRYVSMRQGTGDDLIVRKNIRSTLKMGLIFSLLAMVALVLLSGWLVSTVFHGSILLRIVIIVNATTLPFCILTMIAAYATQGFKLLKYRVFVNNIFTPAILLLVMVASYFLISSETAIILPLLISSAAGSVVILFFLKRLTDVRLSQIIPAKFDLEILRFSYPLMFVAVIGTFMHWMDIMMLGYFMDESVVGLYHPAIRTVGLLRITFLALTNIFSPILSELYVQKKQEEMSSLYKLVVRWILTSTLPFAILLIMFPGKTMLLFGGQYIRAATVLQVLAIATLVQSFTGAGASALNMTGHPKVNLINSIIAVVINVILNVLWIPRYGIMGAALATLVSLSILGLLRSVEVWFFAKLHPFNSKLLKPVVASIVSYFILLLIKPYLMPFHTLLTLSFALVVAFFSFGCILWLLGFDSDDREVWKAWLMIRKASKRK